MSETARARLGCAHIVAMMLFYLVVARGSLEHVRADFVALTFEGQLLALEFFVAGLLAVGVALIAWLVRGWPSRNCAQCHDLLRERIARRVARLARAGRLRPMANTTLIVLLVTLAFLPIEWAHRVLLARYSEGSAATHWLMDAAVVAALGVAIASWQAGRWRLDRGVAPGPVWIWLYGHAMLAQDARLAREEIIMTEGTVELVRFSTNSEAEILAGVLESEGLEAFVADDETAMTPSVRVLVLEADLARAKELLAEHRKIAEGLPENVEPPDPDGV